MKNLAMGILFVLLLVNATQAQEARELTIEEKQQIKKLAKDSLRFLTIAKAQEVRAIVGSEMIVGTPCTGFVSVAKTNSAAFREHLDILHSASQEAQEDFATDDVWSVLSIDDDYLPLRKNDVLVIGQNCVWGLLFRQEKNIWKLKGFFSALMMENKESKKIAPVPAKEEKEKKQNRRPARSSPKRVFFNISIKMSSRTAMRHPAI